MIQKKSNIYVLWVHDQAFSKEELVINPEHFPKLKVGDIVEVSSPTNTGKRLCLRVKTLGPVKGTLQISIAKYIASVFDFANRREVIVNVVPEKTVNIDFIELSFKDQYIGRSDMWRLKLSLQNECVYVLKKLSFAQIRAQVEEIVANGQKMSSGLIGENTKFVFRSRSARFVLFIQMSKEMWDYSAADGELYFEKAVNGFLTSLFARWRTLSVNHTITIILFSRTFHESTEILNEVPNVPRNSQGKLYQDFYKVVVSEETRPDWASIIVQLKKEFNNYHTSVNWDIYGRNSALGQNSTASQGNFLEAINLGMSYFDKHFIDRDFTRTGQMIVVVSAGTGIFEVDQDINLITKQRMIDNGIGCDLICLNKHPLHIVPLFKYNDKNIDTKHQYNVPYWLAISFYDDSITTTTNSSSTSTMQIKNEQSSSEGGCNINAESDNIDMRSAGGEEMTKEFIPQFRIPEKSMNYYSGVVDKPLYNFYIPKDPRKFPGFQSNKLNKQYTSHSLGVNSYEDTIFNLPVHENLSGESNQYSMDSSIVEDYMPSDTDQSDFSDTEDNTPSSPPSITHNPITKRKQTQIISTNNTSANNINQTKYSSYDRKTTVHRYIPNTGRQHNQHLNSHIHHNSPAAGMNAQSFEKRLDIFSTPTASIVSKSKASINPFTYDSSPFHLTGNRRRWSHLWFSPNTYIFGKTNANPNPFLPNWKSLCEPASLPITTDYFPTAQDLKTNYVEYFHNLTPDNIEAMLKELISQRLAQGYQLIMQSSETLATPGTPSGGSATNTPVKQGTSIISTLSSPFRANKKTSYQLSLGHDFHLITYEPSSQNIQVQRYTKHYRNNQTKSIKYHYYLCAMHQSSFTYQSANLIHQIASNYNWNSVDNIISSRDDDEKPKQSSNESIFPPNIKYWRIQYVILPISPTPPQILNTPSNQSISIHDIIEEEEPIPVQVNSASASSSSILSPHVIQSSQPLSSSPSTTSSGNNSNNNNNNSTFAINSMSAPTSPIVTNKSSSTVVQKQVLAHSTSMNQGQQSISLKSPPSMTSSIGISTSTLNSSATPMTTSSESYIVPEHNEEDRIAAFIKFKEFLNSQITRNNTSTNKQPKRVEAKTCFSMSIEDNGGGFTQGLTGYNSDATHSITIGGSRGHLSSSGGLTTSEPSAKLPPQDLEAIFNKMNATLPMITKKIGTIIVKTYKKCATANQIIEWLLKNVDTLLTRTDAINFGALMMSKKYILEIERDNFADCHLYYRLKEGESDSGNSSNVNNSSSSTLKKQDSSQSTQKGSNGMSSQQSSIVNSPIKSPDQSPISSPKYNKSQPNVLGTSIRTSDSFNLLNTSSYSTNHIVIDDNLMPSPSNSYQSNISDGLRNSSSTPIPTSPPLGGSGSYSNNASFALSPSNFVETFQNPNNTDEVKIEMDSTKTDRNEWMTMIYDKTFCPTRFFHMEFRWMVSTGCVVDDFINACARKAKQFGLTLTQIPMEKNYSPFYSPVFIKLLPELMTVPNLNEMLRIANFIPDFIQKRPSSLVKRNDIYVFNRETDTKYTEFIHRSGLLIVRVHDEGLFCYTNNAPSNRSSLSQALSTLNEFETYCNDCNRRTSQSMQSPESPTDFLFDPNAIDDVSPQTQFLRNYKVPPNEGNFITLFAQGYTSSFERAHHIKMSQNPDEKEELERIEKAEMNDSEFLYYSVLSESPSSGNEQ